MPEKKKYCINRVEKLKTHGRGSGTLSQSLGHLDHHERSADIAHPELSHLNRSFIQNPKSFKEIAKRLDKLRAEHDRKIDEWNKAGNTPKRRHLQKRATQTFEGVLTFSPDMSDKVDIDQWVRENVKFIKKEFEAKGCTILRCELHMDEETPHIHFLCAVNGKDGKYLASEILGGRGDLSKMQDEYAKAMQQFDLQRGHSRYNEYMNLRRRAIHAGYGDKYEDVKRFADDNKIKCPIRRRHTSVRVWKAEQERELEKVEKRVQRTKAIIEREGEFLNEEQIKLLNRCENDEALLRAAASMKLQDGRTVLDLLGEKVQNDRRGRGNGLDR